MYYSKGDLLCNYSMTSFLILHSLLYTKTALPCLPRIFDAIRPKDATAFYILVSCTNNNETPSAYTKYSFHLLHTPYKLRQRKIHSLAQFSFIKDTIRYDTIRYDTIRYDIIFI